MREELDIVSEALAQHPAITQILGCMNADTDGLHVIIDGEQYIVTVRPRHDGESFTLYEIQELGPKGHAR